MQTSHATTQNHILAAFPAVEYDRLSPHLELVTMPLGDVLCESGDQLQHVYFPTTSEFQRLLSDIPRGDPYHDLSS